MLLGIACFEARCEGAELSGEYDVHGLRGKRMELGSWWGRTNKLGVFLNRTDKS
jgi:hypothetical protein